MFHQTRLAWTAIMALFVGLCGCGTTVPTAITATHIPTKTLPALQPTATSLATLSLAQKAEVVAIITSNTAHYQHIWQDGQTALGDHPYADATVGLAAFTDPTSAASTFRDFRTAEDPAADLSFIDAFKQADGKYTGSIPDDALSLWRDDTLQLTADMEKWVHDGVSWQISTIPNAQLMSDAQAVTTDFTTLQKDIQAIQ